MESRGNERELDKKQPLGIWWWHTRGIREPVDGVPPGKMLDFLEHFGATDLFLGMGCRELCSGEGEASREDIRRFLRDCWKRGIRVAALCGMGGPGTDAWLDSRNQYQPVRELIDGVREYNRSAAEEERFYGVHLDIEPHTLPDWKERQGLYLQQTADLAAAMRPLCEEAELELEYDIGGFLQDAGQVSLPDGRQTDFIEAMSRSCHTLAVMAYRVTAEGQMDFGPRQYLPYTERNGCRLLVGCETGDLDPENGVPPEVTYRSVGKAAFEREMTRLRRLLKEGGFAGAGVAIHHAYTLYSLLHEDA